MSFTMNNNATIINPQHHDHHDEMAHDHFSHTHNHIHSSKDDDNIILAKLITMFTLFFLSTIFGILPFKFKNQMLHNDNNKLIISTLLSFGGGVLLCTTFLHLLPEVNENIEGLKLNSNLNGELLMCCGFFIIYLIEEFVHRYIRYYESKGNSSLKNNNNDPFIRGLNVRESVIKRNSCMHEAQMRKNESSDIQLNKPRNSTLSTLQLIDIETNPHEKINSSNITAAAESISIDNDNHQLTTTSTSSILPALPSRNERIGMHEPQPSELHHSHTHVESATLVTSLRGLLIVLALSIHELFEGLAIGLESATLDVWYMFGAVAAHKLVIAFCIGVELCVQKTQLYLGIIYVIIFAIVSPIGIGIGILLSETDETYTLNFISVILQGLATGTLLYVIFFEVLTKDRSGLVQYLAIVIGFFLMFGLQFLSKDIAHYVLHNIINE